MDITHVPIDIGFINPRRLPPRSLSNFDLHKETDTTGVFWIPSNESVKIPGQLFFIPGGGLRLILNGSFDGGPKRQTEFAALNGNLAKGTTCTLLKAWGNVNQFNSNHSAYITDLHCEYFIAGGCFSKEDDININMLDIQFSHIDKWFNRPFDLVWNKDSSEYLMCFQPDEAKSEVKWKDEVYQINLFCSRKIPMGAGSNETKFKYAYRFHLESKNKQQLHKFLEVASLLRESFMFLIGTGIYTLEITAVEDNSQQPGTNFGLNHYRIFTGVDVPSYIRTDTSLYCTQYDTFKDYFDVFIKEWFNNRNRLAVVINTYTEILLNDGAFEENIFLRIVQTLEYLHGIVFKKSKFCTKSEWKAFVDWLEKNTPIPSEDNSNDSLDLKKLQDLRNITLKRVSSLNSLTLKTRLEDLFEGVKGGCLWPAIGNPSDPRQRIKEIIIKVEETRHYLTHFRESLENKISKGLELEENTALLWGLLTYWLGQSLRLPESIVDELSYQATRAMFLVGKRTKL